MRRLLMSRLRFGRHGHRPARENGAVARNRIHPLQPRMIPPHKKHRLARSTLHKGGPSDNTQIRGFFKRLKTEIFYTRGYASADVEEFVVELARNPSLQRERARRGSHRDEESMRNREFARRRVADTQSTRDPLHFLTPAGRRTNALPPGVWYAPWTTKLSAGWLLLSLISVLLLIVCLFMLSS